MKAATSANNIRPSHVSAEGIAPGRGTAGPREAALREAGAGSVSTVLSNIGSLRTARGGESDEPDRSSSSARDCPSARLSENGLSVIGRKQERARMQLQAHGERRSAQGIDDWRRQRPNVQITRRLPAAC